MAGRLVVTTLNNDTGVLATQNGMTGIAKAWVNFNGLSGASPVVRNSFNVSSVTRNSTGQYTVNFTTAMPNVNYTVACSGSFDSSGTGNYGFNVQKSFGANTTTSMQIGAVYANGSLYSDGAYIDATVFGN